MKHKLSERIKNFNITILISLFLLLSCGSGQQAANSGSSGTAVSNSLIELGRSAENVFYSFMTLVSDTLGFTVTKDTKKSEVGDYFNSLGVKLGEASKELEKLAKISETDVDKDGLLKKAIRGAVDAAKATLNTLKGHLDSLKDIGDDNKVGEATSNQSGVSADENALKVAYKALKGIVDTAKTGGEIKEPIASNVTVAQASIGGTDAKNGAKVLTAGAVAGGTAGPEAALIVSSVRGEEILAAIVKSAEGDATGTIGGNADGSTSALKFARGGATAANLAQDAALTGAVSGGIALRSLVKDGKLASHNANSDEKAVQAAGITAVNKLLVAVEDIIKKTVKNVLEKAKGKIDKVRGPQEPVSELSKKQ
ncbi:Variable large protein 18 (plasmid) [Borrelia turicatae]|uniref:Variable large protein n=1 Tax=Borrelia turicatae TaxID=142 RepID=A0A172XDC2_BORTU|nr:variable large family protein [Borrelia turicatae]ANF34558.1 Variable large protein 18 [Borrelia turicatae]UPA15731.1 variable large family protein [Borrelia turicatae]